jgi:hypothetical protein
LVIATAVLAYDLASDGAITYTNGSRIFALDSDGQSREIGKGRLIERVQCVEIV